MDTPSSNPNDTVNPLFSGEQPVESQKPAEQATRETPTEQANEKRLTLEQFNALQQKARNYETIVADPNANRFLTEYFSDLSTGSTNDIPAQSSNKQADTKASPELSKLQEVISEQNNAIKYMHRELGKLSLEVFKTKNTDFDQHIDTVREILREAPNMPTHLALELARSRKAASASTNSQSKGKSATPQTEITSAGNVSEPDYLKEAKRRILDRKATPGNDSWIDEAIAAARKHTGS